MGNQRQSAPDVPMRAEWQAETGAIGAVCRGLVTESAEPLGVARRYVTMKRRNEMTWNQIKGVWNKLEAMACSDGTPEWLRGHERRQEIAALVRVAPTASPKQALPRDPREWK